MKIMVVSFMKRRGMALFPLILVKTEKDRKDEFLINHERIHIRQQAELLILPFYLFYFLNYLYNLITCLDHEKAYRNIIFEQEAYDHEREKDYLKSRKFLSFLNYL